MGVIVEYLTDYVMLNPLRCELKGELDGLLDGILNDASTTRPVFKGFAQVKPFRFSNNAVRDLKKKP